MLISDESFANVANEERSSWRLIQPLDHSETLDDTDWRDLRKAYDALVDNNTAMKANLQADRPQQWLTPFGGFGKPDTADLKKQLLEYPYVQNLCRPALRRPRPTPPPSAGSPPRGRRVPACREGPGVHPQTSPRRS